ncbi:pimeloyl-ACP methyl ester carboxylesterase [Crossiella equi]|uniref:Pimeloyl-ACP methyl ester carboxylesterase n=1 Tax=Crossiella equi TaxID=130796 RepID=A0ABS5A4U5_9PSEU|nr:alpha/beta fold hydrolase [Crossiella equi]MBP2471605.1 pimeloyl-ACP methyl ester carboxylesterase [Crossiella equi]
MSLTSINLPGLTVAVDDRGEGGAVLLLHGGGGPGSVTALQDALVGQARVLRPVHPGFDGQPRPDGVDTIADLASAYLDLLDELDLTDVLVVGNSIGGWIASEMAVRDNHRRVRGLVLLNAVGIPPEFEGQVVHAGDLELGDYLDLLWHDPANGPDLTALSPADLATLASNVDTLNLYAGQPYMHDPKLPARLHRVGVPVLVAWGEADRAIPADYGRAYAGLFPDATFELVPGAGHLPQVEATARVAELVRSR